jgi:hypothetical protein
MTLPLCVIEIFEQDAISNISYVWLSKVWYTSLALILGYVTRPVAIQYLRRHRCALHQAGTTDVFARQEIADRIVSGYLRQVYTLTRRLLVEQVCVYVLGTGMIVPVGQVLSCVWWDSAILCTGNDYGKRV